MRSLRTPLLVASLVALPLAAAHAQTPPDGAVSKPPAAATASAPAPSAAPDAAPEESATAAAETAKPSGGLPPLAKDDAVAGGIGLASLVVGLAMIGVSAGIQGGLADSAPKDVLGNPVCGRKPGGDATLATDAGKCDSLRSQAALGNALGNVGVGVAITGGLLVGAAAAYWLFGSAAPASPGPRAAATPAPSLKIAPAVGAGFGGLVVVGTF
ncbi:MAG: hypothetical protein U0441_08115 [Polyangiaceae bacterium]